MGGVSFVSGRSSLVLIGGIRPVQGCCQLFLVGQGVLLRGRQGVVGVCGYGHGGVGLVQGVADGVVVSAAADQDAHRGGVGRTA